MADPGSTERRRRDRVLFERHRTHGDARSREELVERFLPLARKLARRFQQGQEPLDDLVQVASLGLVKAVDRFDIDRDVSFATYAVPTILGELKRHFRDKTWAVRVPRGLQELALRVEGTATRLTEQLGHAPTVGEIAEAVGAGDEEVLEALEARGAQRAVSFEAPRRADDVDAATLADVVGHIEPGLELAEDRQLLDGLMCVLGQREREVLRLRFAEDMTQAEIGAIIGVSQMQISRIVRDSLSRMRTAAAAQGLGITAPV